MLHLLRLIYVDLFIVIKNKYVFVIICDKSRLQKHVGEYESSGYGWKIQGQLLEYQLDKKKKNLLPQVLLFSVLRTLWRKSFHITIETQRDLYVWKRQESENNLQ